MYDGSPVRAADPRNRGRRRSSTVYLATTAHAVRWNGLELRSLDCDPSTWCLTLFIGSLSEEKDPIAAITAFGRTAEEADLELAVIGDGPLLGAAQDVISANDFEKRVEFTGSVEDIAPRLAWAEVLLLTSRTEGLPGVVIEAAASGLPVVAYDVGAVDEIVEDASSGIVIHDGTVESAARALVMLAHEDDLRLRFGDRAREIVSERFLLESTVEQTDRVLRDQLI